VPARGDVPSGNPGEIWARGYAIMKSYFNASQATAEALTEDGSHRTASQPQRQGAEVRVAGARKAVAG
jgi:acyl-CoA synthetase (AMP-forming)/AMP-acid ligase II